MAKHLLRVEADATSQNFKLTMYNDETDALEIIVKTFATIEEKTISMQTVKQTTG